MYEAGEFSHVSSAIMILSEAAL
ncbi:hypothetical protein BGLA2_780005 [Burkholderia gladioli]|nr:hypothetical protein BGLA2_780005 [Burkholderia gladioli]